MLLVLSAQLIWFYNIITCNIANGIFPDLYLYLLKKQRVLELISNRLQLLSSYCINLVAVHFMTTPPSLYCQVYRFATYGKILN